MSPAPVNPLGSVRAVVDRFEHDAGSMVVGGQPLASVLPRQLVFEAVPNASGSVDVAGATPAAEAALRANPRWGSLVDALAGVANSTDGARLRTVAFTDSPAGFLATDSIGV